MNKRQRIRNVLLGLLMIMCAMAILVSPEDGVPIIMLVISVSFALAGIRDIIYFITMARHMVGGKMVLYKGIITLDLGLFGVAVANIPQVYAMLYLIIGYLFSGVIDVIGAMEAKGLEAGSWKFKLVNGIMHILIAILCMFSLHSTDTLVLFFSAGLIYSACTRIIQAFRRTAIVYIQ